MSGANTPFNFSHELQITPPAAERACPVPEQDWHHLKGCVKRIQTGSLFFHTVGSALLGVAGSALVTALVVPRPADKIEAFAVSVTCWAIIGTAGVSGILSLCFASLQRRQRETTKEEVLEEFGLLEARYLRPLSNAGSVPFGPDLEGLLLNSTFTLVFQPPNEKKEMQFGKGGVILKGRNQNESQWRIVDGKLEFLTESAAIFSRFHYNPYISGFDSEVEPGTICDHSQYMIPIS